MRLGAILAIRRTGSGQGRLSLRSECSRTGGDHRLSVIRLTVIAVAAGVTGCLRVGGVDDGMPVHGSRDVDRVHGSVDHVVVVGGGGVVGTGKINAGRNAFNIGSVVE